MIHRLSLLLAVLGILLCPSQAQTQTAQMGKPFPVKSLVFVDPAPEVAGKALIVEFWATWCGPCVKMIPHLNELYGKYKEKGLLVVGVSQDFTKDEIAPFRKKTPINYPVAFDEGMKFGQSLGVEAIPWAFVVDRKGKVIWEGLSAKLTEETVEQALK